MFPMFYVAVNLQQNNILDKKYCVVIFPVHRLYCVVKIRHIQLSTICSRIRLMFVYTYQTNWCEIIFISFNIGQDASFNLIQCFRNSNTIITIYKEISNYYGIIWLFVLFIHFISLELFIMRPLLFYMKNKLSCFSLKCINRFAFEHFKYMSMIQNTLAYSLWLVHFVAT